MEEVARQTAAIMVAYLKEQKQKIPQTTVAEGGHLDAKHWSELLVAWLGCSPPGDEKLTVMEEARFMKMYMEYIRLSHDLSVDDETEGDILEDPYLLMDMHYYKHFLSKAKQAVEHWNSHQTCNGGNVLDKWQE